MLVKELIDRLAKFPQDARVVLNYAESTDECGNPYLAIERKDWSVYLAKDTIRNSKGLYFSKHDHDETTIEDEAYIDDAIAGADAELVVALDV